MRKISSLLSVFALLSLLVFTSGTALAQGGGTTASITGTVTDQQGGAVAGANVTATNPATNFSRQTTSSENGIYRIDLLPVGTYTVSIEAPGFKKIAVTN